MYNVICGCDIGDYEHAIPISCAETILKSIPWEQHLNLY